MKWIRAKLAAAFNPPEGEARTARARLVAIWTFALVLLLTLPLVALYLGLLVGVFKAALESV